MYEHIQLTLFKIKLYVILNLQNELKKFTKKEENLYDTRKTFT